MTYRDQLLPWCIIRVLPAMQRSLVTRLRRRSEAKEYLKALKQLNPSEHYFIVFDSTGVAPDASIE